MTNATLVNNLRYCEQLVFRAGLILTFLILSLWIINYQLYYSIALGYYLSNLAFVFFLECLIKLTDNAQEKKSKTWFVVVSVIKTLGLLIALLWLSTLGCELIELLLGMFIVQPVILVAFLAMTIKMNAKTESEWLK